MIIRPLQDGDTNFILSTWLRSHYASLQFYSSGTIIVPYPRDDVYFQGHQDKIKAVMALPGTRAMVCVAPDEPTQIMGWIVFDDETVHYCYVKAMYRRMGIGKRLVASASSASKYSHHTKHSKYINKGLQYDPYKF